MFRSVWTCLWVVAVGAPLAAAEPLEFYAKCGTLQQTMLATRARVQRWQAAQEMALRAVQVGPWHGAVVGSGEQLDALEMSRRGVTAATTPQTGGPQWNPVTSNGNHWASDSLAAIFSVDPLPADYVATTIHADRPVTLTFELSRYEWFGGFAYRPPASGAGVQPSDALIWLNGRQVALHNRLAGYERVPVARRRSWHERFVWHDAVLVDLTLQPGENHLVVSLHKPERKPWFNCVRFSSQPTSALWSMIEHDFPRAGNRLLEYADAGWFDCAQGWFAQDGVEQFERPFIAQLVRRLGADGEAIERRLDGLVSAQTPSSDISWLDLCVAAAERHAAFDQTAALRVAVAELAAAYPQEYPGPQLLGHIEDLAARFRGADRLDPADEQTAGWLRELDELKREALVAQNPLLADRQLLFVKRSAYDSDHYYDEFITGTHRFGGGLFTLSLRDGTVREVAPALSQGIVDRYDLSCDGQRIVFNYKPPRPEGFRLHEIGVDGTGLRQITFPPEDESQRIARYCTWSPAQLQEDPWRYGHWTDDMHPCYLPDGGIAFTSTRGELSVLCGGHGLTVPNLHRVEPDGSSLRRLSQGALSEFCPTMLSDGRIMYNRWEYVDKGAGAVQSLWAMCPDGSRTEEIYGNNIDTPGVFSQAKQVPGRDNLVVCLGAPHSPANIGAILLIDRHKEKRSAAAMTALTPGSVPKGNWGLRQFRNGRWLMDIYGPWYCDPFPLADRAGAQAAGTFFLVSCNPDGMWNDPAGYGIYLLDVFGNRVPIYRDPATSSFQARPLQPRPVPPVAPPVAPGVAPDNPQADVFLADVHQGLDGVPPGTIKYLRVMEQVARPWSVYRDYEPSDAAPGQMVAVSLYTHLSVKVLHGVVPVQEDGSAHFTVPAGRNIFLQALDADFMEVQRMRTFVNLLPGERRSCIGCHEHRNLAPANRRPLALDRPRLDPQPQPGETAPRPIHYPTDVQPIFDRHCVSCHNPDRPESTIDLTGDPTELFCRSYENIIHQDLVGYIQEFIGPKPEGADAMGYAPAVPPYTYGSHQSRLIAVLRAGHYDVQLPREDFIRLVTWVDANAPYYGSYFGRRNIAFRDRGNFRAVPTLEAALGQAPHPD